MVKIVGELARVRGRVNDDAEGSAVIVTMRDCTDF